MRRKALHRGAVNAHSPQPRRSRPHPPGSELEYHVPKTSCRKENRLAPTHSSARLPIPSPRLARPTRVSVQIKSNCNRKKKDDAGGGDENLEGCPLGCPGPLTRPGKRKGALPPLPKGRLTEAQSDSTGGGTGPASGDPAQEAPSEGKGLCSWGGGT